MINQPTKFIAEVSSNHHKSLERCKQFIKISSQIGCDAVKFQLFKVDELFAPEILSKSKMHRDRVNWQLPVKFLPELKNCCKENNIQFACTPFYLQAVNELKPYVDFYKIASYELLWDNLLKACAKTEIPIVISTGMATIDEIDNALMTLKDSGAKDITILHCVSAYPTPESECNLSVLETFRKRYNTKVGWSDHTVSQAVLNRAINRWQADTIEFHLDLDKTGEEYAAGHCWLPDQIAPIIHDSRLNMLIDGESVKQTVLSEQADRDWRADPSDGLRPMLNIRKNFE